MDLSRRLAYAFETYHDSPALGHGRNIQDIKAAKKELDNASQAA